MGLGKTLLKVAIGVAVAKGVSTLVKGAGSSGSTRTASRDNGLGDIMDGIGGTSRTAPRQAPRETARETSGGGLGDLLGQLTNRTCRAPGAPTHRWAGLKICWAASRAGLAICWAS